MIRDTRPHGPTWEKNTMCGRTLCRCGKAFDDDRGFYVHMGKMNKISERVKSLTLERKQD